MMRRLVFVLVLIVTVALPLGALDYEATALKANRLFEQRDWPSAQAMYELMLSERPDSTDTYAHAIVVAQMRADSVRAVDLLERAMSHSVGVQPLFDRVRSVAFSIGRARIYPDFLRLAVKELPWLARPVERLMLQYYLFRDNGPKVVEYGLLMTDGLPDDVGFLADLSRGYMLSADYDSAVACWKRILDLDPNNYLTLINLGNYYLLINRPDLGLPYLERANNLRSTPYLESIIHDSYDT